MTAHVPENGGSDFRDEGTRSVTPDRSSGSSSDRSEKPQQSSQEHDILSSIESIGEMLLTACARSPCGARGSYSDGGPVSGISGPMGGLTSGRGVAGEMIGCFRAGMDRPASPTYSMGRQSPSSGPAYGDPSTSNSGGVPPGAGVLSPCASLVHSKAFPPLQNVVSADERFFNATATDVMNTFFNDDGTRSIERFHMERGDDSVRFGRWTRLPMVPMTHRFHRSRSDVESLHDSGGSGLPANSLPPLRTHSRHDSGPPTSSTRPAPPRPAMGGPGSAAAIATSSTGGQPLSLLGSDVPPFLLTRPVQERHGTFRTPVRVPAAGMSVTEVSIVQRLFRMGGNRRRSISSSAGRSVRRAPSGMDDDSTYVVESVLRLLDVPYSDRFRVVMRQTVSTEQRTGVSENHTIDECLACSIPLCNPNTIPVRMNQFSRSAGSAASTSSLVQTVSSAVVRLEFEIQFHRTCLYEDRIRKMLTKKINKLMLSWCLWAQDGWVEDRPSTSPTARCMGMPVGEACAAMAGCGGDAGDSNSVVSGGSPLSSHEASSKVKKWQSLSKRNDSFLLWSMTDIDEQEEDDIYIPEDDTSLASDMSNVGLHRLEWRNRSLSGKEQVTSNVTSTNAGPAAAGTYNDYNSDRSSYRGQGIELCLSDDEDYHPSRSPRQRRVFADATTGDKQCLSPYGIEVIYNSDGSANSDTEPDDKVGGLAGMSIPNLQGASSLAPADLPSTKGRGRGGFNRRKHLFGNRNKRLKALEERNSEAETTSTATTEQA